ncbi:MAG: diguanylate cyclase [Candidatus Viridilinea halotolerans]|uniref:Diguanylate cyclase n=1 Tax=Candidatus Viridilinea halotolerans TaxID=2491704 RepID=A0A426TVE9_9CHLR|nr:MAG: diguanylate cyclase [Candidatus Viridilinea halotolerans]
MSPKLRICVCRYYYAEVAAALAALGAQDVSVETYGLSCDRPVRQTLKLGTAAQLPAETERLFIGVCALVPDPGRTLPQMPERMLRLDHCLTMLSGPVLFQQAVRSGAYLITPGWLQHWPEHLQRWGFDQALAREFFRDTVSELLLLNTGTDPEAPAELVRFADYVQRPYQIHAIGLDYLQLFLERAILDWRLGHTKLEAQRAVQQANRKSADYAMAFDLLVNLAELRTEEETIQAIQNMAGMLFGSTRLAYGQVRASRIVQIYALPETGNEHAQLTQALAAIGKGYTLDDGADGFFLRIQHQRETFGILAVGGITFPEHRHQYLNLGMAIANLCGLALANARSYSILHATEQSLRRERDLSDQLREAMSDLSSTIEHERLIDQILSLLQEIIPNQLALLLLWEGATLRVINERSQLTVASLLAFEVHVEEEPFSLVLQRQAPLILGSAALSKLPPHPLFSALDLQSWMGVPLLHQHQVVGMLSIGSREADLYHSEHARGAQMLANEMASALEQERIVTEANTLASTDPLTGLYNRRRFSELAEQSFRYAQRNSGWLSLIFLDLDHFKRINDDFSHLVGDQVLVAVSTMLKQLRDTEIAARYGGEEFVIISSTSDLSAMRQLAERLRRTIANSSISTMGGNVQITASFGVASITPEMQSLGDLIWRADQALYAAKNAGRNRVCVWGEQAIG